MLNISKNDAVSIREENINRKKRFLADLDMLYGGTGIGKDNTQDKRNKQMTIKPNIISEENKHDQQIRLFLLEFLLWV